MPAGPRATAVVVPSSAPVPGCERRLLCRAGVRVPHALALASACKPALSKLPGALSPRGGRLSKRPPRPSRNGRCQSGRCGGQVNGAARAPHWGQAPGCLGPLEAWSASADATSRRRRAGWRSLLRTSARWLRGSGWPPFALTPGIGPGTRRCLPPDSTDSTAEGLAAYLPHRAPLHHQRSAPPRAGPTARPRTYHEQPALTDLPLNPRRGTYVLNRILQQHTGATAASTGVSHNQPSPSRRACHWLFTFLRQHPKRFKLDRARSAAGMSRPSPRTGRPMAHAGPHEPGYHPDLLSASCAPLPAGSAPPRLLKPIASYFDDPTALTQPGCHGGQDLARPGVDADAVIREVEAQ